MNKRIATTRKLSTLLELYSRRAICPLLLPLSLSLFPPIKKEDAIGIDVSFSDRRGGAKLKPSVSHISTGAGINSLPRPFRSDAAIVPVTSLPRREKREEKKGNPPHCRKNSIGSAIYRSRRES